MKLGKIDGFIRQTSRGNPALAIWQWKFLVEFDDLPKNLPIQTSIYFRYVPYKVVPQFGIAKLVRL